MGAFLFNVDYFQMFDVSGEGQDAQVRLAAAIMSPSFQETFNLVQGSIPARTAIPGDKFDACAKESMADLKAAVLADSLFGNGAIGHIIHLFDPAECENYFKAAGYDPT